MKKVIMLLLLVFKFSIASFAQTYFAFGVDESKLTLENNANKLVLDEEKLIQPSMRIVYGYENIWAYWSQTFWMRTNPKR